MEINEFSSRVSSGIRHHFCEKTLRSKSIKFMAPYFNANCRCAPRSVAFDFRRDLRNHRYQYLCGYQSLQNTCCNLSPAGILAERELLMETLFQLASQSLLALNFVTNARIASSPFYQNNNFDYSEMA